MTTIIIEILDPRVMRLLREIEKLGLIKIHEDRPKQQPIQTP